MSGVTIGSGSVIAAGSVVARSVPPYSIAGGNPAQIIRQRFPDTVVEELLELQWWHRSDEEINQIVPLLQLPTNQTVIEQIKTTLKAQTD